MSLLHTKREAAAQVQRALGFSVPFTWRERLATFYIFARWRWVRRSAGGKWECWWSDIAHSMFWWRVQEWSTATGVRPPAGPGDFIAAEEW